ncbi:MAG: carboxymuconolactone decarboxylase family protein [Candidatus Thermoplasmatota archaeon]|jgi:AhpD family alkylhydroperoxidase|nr:carboxymuconolactone decarboxylase family protein [Candidatus Thermoplasmatota archaeon]
MVRFNYRKVVPTAYETMFMMQKYVDGTGIDKQTMELIKIRASQINGCAFCLDMHTQDVLAIGIGERKIFTVSVWKESPFFTQKEKMALELTEYVTRISQNGVPDGLYQKAMELFSQEEYVNLIMCINVINCWNRLNIACGFEAGIYNRKQPQTKSEE